MTHWCFFDDHEASVVREATARLAPGPSDDPSEHGSPGAREADAVRYIDNLLGGLRSDPPTIYAADDPATGFLRLTAPQREGWRTRLAALGVRYRTGIDRLERCSGPGGFLARSAPERDEVLAMDEIGAFRSIMFEHTIEAMYARPVYGGNQRASCWRDIGYRPARSTTFDLGARPPTRDAPLQGLVEEALDVVVQLLLATDRHHWYPRA